MSFSKICLKLWFLEPEVESQKENGKDKPKGSLFLKNLTNCFLEPLAEPQRENGAEKSKGPKIYNFA